MNDRTLGVERLHNRTDCMGTFLYKFWRELGVAYCLAKKKCHN